MNRVLLEILHILFKHKTLVFASFAVIFLSVAVGLLLQPSEYRASGHLMLTGQRAYFRLAPEESRTPPLEPDLRDISTEMENLRGNAFLTKVADALPFSLAEEIGVNGSTENPGYLTRAFSVVSKGVRRVASIPRRLRRALSSALVGENTATDTNGAMAPPPNPSLPFLRAGLEVVPVPNSFLVEVAYTHRDPQRATKVVNTVLDLYPAHQASLYQDPASLAFYDKQTQLLAEEIVEIENKIRTFQAQERIVSLPEQRTILFALIDKVQDRLKGADLDIDQGKGKIAEIERQLAREPEQMMVVSQDTVDPETRQIHEKLVQLEIDKNELLQKYTEQDRRVQDRMREIAALKERLATAATKKVVVSERLGLNAVRQGLLRELTDQKVKLGQIYAKRETLARQLEELQAEVMTLSTKGLDFQHLQEILANKKEQYLLYSKKAEEARIAAALDREQLVNVKVVDPAQVPLIPVATGAALALALATFVGIGTGVGGALALEYLRPTFHSAVDVERHLELPVLALIPDLRENT
jgi:uncharacterized protein involved in exopolysaccharide biosynthesis